MSLPRSGTALANAARIAMTPRALVVAALLGAVAAARCGSSATSSPATPTPSPTNSPVVFDAPVPVAPAPDSPQSTRPTLVVRDAARSGPASLVYEFEVARDEQFAARLAAATVAETPDQTSLTVSTDLERAATVFWRARAVDRNSGVQSAWSRRSTLVIRSTDDGILRYRLDLFVPDTCDPLWTNQHLPPSLNPIVFDDALVVQGNTLTFSPLVCNTRGPFALALTGRGATVAGTIGGETFHPAVGCGPALIVQVGADPTSNRPRISGVSRTTGVARSDGSFEGTFDGAFNLFNTINIGLICSSPSARWTLTPAAALRQPRARAERRIPCECDPAGGTPGARGPGAAIG
jgi:hypothetical protein